MKFYFKISFFGPCCLDSTELRALISFNFLFPKLHFRARNTNVAFIGFALFSRLIWGWQFSMFFISRQESSERFVKISFYIQLGCGLFASLLSSYFLVKEQMYQALVLIFLLLLASALYTYFKSPFVRIASLIIHLLAPLALFYSLEGFPALGIINFYTSGLLLGTIFCSQFLGHWYLNAPNLHIDEFKRVVNIMLLSFGIKTAEVCFYLWKYAYVKKIIPINLDATANLTRLNVSESIFRMQGNFVLGLGFFGALMFLSRMLWGIFTPALFALQVQKSVKQRATQSATGILYAMSVMALIGELIALYMHKTLGWYV